MKHMFGFGKRGGTYKHIAVVVCAGNSPRHGFLANTLAAHFSVVGIVSEATRPHLVAQIAEKHPLVRLHYGAIYDKEVQYFGRDKLFKIERSNVAILPHAPIGGGVLADFMRKRNPHYIVSFDASPIPESFIRSYSGTILHLHNGLIHYYDGADANLWPVIDEHIERIGMTVHRIEGANDAGGILGQIRPELAGGDTLADMELKAILAGVELTVHCIKRHSAKRLSQKVCDRSGAALHRREDLTPAALLKVKEAMERGAVGNFLNHQSKLYRESPIFNAR